MTKSETIGERFRRLGDELSGLTGGRHYFGGVQQHPTLYLFSFGSYHDASKAQQELDRRLEIARLEASRKADGGR